MKKLIMAAVTLAAAANVFAQGTVQLNNGIAGTLITHIYAPNSGNPTLSQIGNGSNDTPSGGTSWAGFTFIGAGGTAGQYGGSTTFAQILSANGANAAESSLSPATTTTTFRTGSAGGRVASAFDVTLSNVPVDAPVATIEVVAWDNSSGLYSTWTQASVAWLNGLIAAGESGRLNINAIGGGLNPAPVLTGLQSFNLYFIPEPSTFALVGLGAAAMLIFRRRK